MKTKLQHPIISAIILLGLFVHVCIGCSFFSSSSVQSEEKRVAITIDDLPLNIAESVNNREMGAITDKILFHIKNHNVPVVGFVNEKGLVVNGSIDAERVGILNKWLDAGVELGNHTYSHKSLHTTPIDEYKKDIVDGESTVVKLLVNHGMKLRYFRHPYLHTGKELQTRDEIVRFLASRGQSVAPVTFDNSEWVFAKAYDNAYAANDKFQMEEIAKSYIVYMRSKQHFFEQQVGELFGRNIRHILVIHANRLNSEYLPELFKMMKDDGYSFITLDEALRDRAYQSANEYAGGGGITWIHHWAITVGKGREFFKGEPLVPARYLKIAGVEHE
ncbi:MAG: polysaccharide deacetylase family protein [Oligoflexia bacterium]|nr:polysaccharide deacetylase family protein [Oligoflexia bacterium]MBF0366944.1 polysaccharide deacetylase family protein [Oligoflexia bacterium]